MTRHFCYLLFGLLLSVLQGHAQPANRLSAALADRLVRLPLDCLQSEFPNKTGHLADSASDARLLPHELHPVFFGCLDWHSSVHGHWMLVYLLKHFPDLVHAPEIEKQLRNSFQIQKMEVEASYFGKYTASKNYERTYGWAWLLKLDEELFTWTNNAMAKQWHTALQPLTKRIVTLWKDYLPKQTYPSRVGTHTNTAFGLGFALDWAEATGDTAFAAQIRDKARYFFAKETNTPAYLEPDGSDFFSPSLEVADLMARVMPQHEFTRWLNHYYSEESIARLCELPVVSDRSDYQIVHLDGLSFSRAWCMQHIAATLPDDHPLKARLTAASEKFIQTTLPQIVDGGYGGTHWLATFAVYALSGE